ncbi:hypothetical protein EDD15DRAFT_2198710 [Pisolithus albus]|nr:hypothetical protein EDD15DRAFT_2198710 [Pisolithus albus]
MNATQLAPLPFFIGATFNVLLYGIMIAQTHVYFATHKADWLWMKIFVPILLGLQITFLFFANTNFLVFVTDPIIAVYILRREVFIVSAIVFCGSVGMLGAVGTTIAAEMFPNFVEFQKLKALVITRLVIATCADLIIATTLILHLMRTFSEPVTMQTGLVPTLFAVTNVVTFLSIVVRNRILECALVQSNEIATSRILKRHNSHLIFSLPLASLHANSLLSRLNSPGGWEHDKLSEVKNCDQGRPQRGNTRFQTSFLSHKVFVHIEEHKLVELNNKLNDSSSQLNGQIGRSDQSKSDV